MKKHYRKRVIGRIALAMFTLLLGVSGARLSQALTTPTVYLPLVSVSGPTGTATRTATVTRTATATVTGTRTATGTSTTTATSMATATATTTVTPTTSAEGCANIYPLAVNLSVMSGGEFRDPGDPALGGRLSSGPYAGLTWRRLYVGDLDLPGDYAWLRWKEQIGANGGNANSMGELEASMTGAGNIDRGFEEVIPWPNSSLPQPPGYPTSPGQINRGDWAHAFSGATTSSTLAAAIDDHIAVGRRLILPVFGHVAGAGNNGVYLIDQFGQFSIIGQRSAGANSYIDLVALADTRPTCATGPSEIWGRVAFEPRWPYTANRSCIPLLEPATYVFPADAFIPYNGLTYPNVGEAQITLIADRNTSFTVPITMINGEMQYRIPNIPAGTYELEAVIWYKDPRDQVNSNPRPYNLISAYNGDPVSVFIIAMPQSSATYHEDIFLRLYGDICVPLEE